MSRIAVLDCSVCGAWCLPDESSPHAKRILTDVVARVTTMLVPSLWWFEMTNVLRTAVRRKRIAVDDARQALFLLGAVPKDEVSALDLGTHGVLAIALAHNLSAYDAAYVHLAQSAGADLYTADSDLLALRNKYPFVKPVSKYQG